MEKFIFSAKSLRNTDCYYISVLITSFDSQKNIIKRETSFLPDLSIISYLTEKQIKNKVKKLNGWIQEDKIVFKNQELALKATNIFDSGITMRVLTGKSVMQEF